MIKCSFEKKDNLLIGFKISGHANSAEYGHDIVCAAVTAACELSVNICTDKFGAESDIEVKGDGKLSFKAKNELENVSKILSGLSDYLKAIKNDYPKCISINYLEV